MLKFSVSRIGGLGPGKVSHLASKSCERQGGSMLLPGWRGKFCLLAVLLTVLSCGRLYAQGGGNGAITGTISDPTGALIPNATVTVTQQSTGQKRATTTNASGTFDVPALPPDAYSVTVEASGFKTSVQQFTLLADQDRDLDVHLELGATSQQVTVEAASVMVDRVSPVLSQVLEQSRVINLPLNGRNAADLTLLVPGTVSANGHGVQQGNTKQVPGAESIAVNGARADQISYNLDGSSNEDLMSNTNNPFPFPDALQEFSVQTNSFDSQYGANVGAVVNVVTKSGTNNWHGDGFEFVRNRVFNANNYFSTTRDPLKRNQFGGTIGGPIIKGHSFIFFGYQATRIRTIGNGQTATLPTPANLTGNFSNYLTTGSTNPKGKVIQILNPTTGAPFAGDTGLPVDPVAVAFAKYLPISQEGPDGRVSFGIPDVENTNEYVARFDQVIRQKDKLYGRVYLDRYQHAPPYDGKDLLTDGTGSTVHTQNYSVGYTWILSPTIVNNSVVSFERAASDRGQGGNVPQMNTLGSNIFQLPQSQGGLRSFNVSNDFNPGGGAFTDGRFIRNTLGVRDQLSWSRGKHTISFGGDFEHDQSNVRNTDLENGSWTITDDSPALPAFAPASTNTYSGLAMANFVIGHLHQFSQTSGNFSDSRENVMGVFAQDNWTVRPRLTLTLGLRYEPQKVMREIYGRTEQFRPDAYAAGVHSTVIPSSPAGLFFVGDSYNGIGFPPTGEKGDFNNLAPRAGFAYDVFGSGKTVVRGGGGVFYSTRLPGLFLNDASISQPFSLRVDLTEPGTTANNLIPLDNPVQSVPGFAAGFPQRFILSKVPKTVAYTPPVTVFGMIPGQRWITPTTYDWNLTVEQQLRSDLALHLSYVGLRNVHLREDIDLNPEGIGIGTQASRAYQPFSDILEDLNEGASNYNALQVSLEKRPQAGAQGILKNITLLVNYTYSKAMDIALANEGGTTDLGSSHGSGVPYGNPLQHQFDTGPSDFDRTHNLVASFAWDLPRLNSANALTRWTIGGWTWSGIFTAATGDPLNLLAGTDQSKTTLGQDRVDFIGSGTFLYGGVAPTNLRTPCTGSGICVPWLDTAVFGKPATGTFGNVGKDAFRGPSHWDMDTALIKNFYPLASHESISAQLRGDFFNIFNHPQFADPTATFSSGNFGQIRTTVGGASDYRIIQLGVKIMF